MKKYIYGLGTDYVRSAAMLAQLGYDGVVIGGTDMDAFRGAKQAGLETWLCYGAHSCPNPLDKHIGAVGADDRPAPWFGSACPNRRENNLHNLESALETAKLARVDGVMVDGARFASFASTEGVFSFFGCFCPVCMEKMTRTGVDAPKLKTAIAGLMGYFRGENPIPGDAREAVDAMLAFRRHCVKEYMDDFTARAHGAGLQAGAFVFSPSLWDFVGQSAGALGSLDLVAPMIYRDYPHEAGPACLGHEWGAFRELVSANAPTAQAVFRRQFPRDDPRRGFSPAFVGQEVLAAKKALREEQQLLPIIQTEDPLLEITVQRVLDGGADGYGEFYFDQKFAPLGNR